MTTIGGCKNIKKCNPIIKIKGVKKICQQLREMRRSSDIFSFYQISLRYYALMEDQEDTPEPLGCGWSFLTSKSGLEV
jgi:hypothetical protein